MEIPEIGRDDSFADILSRFVPGYAPFIDVGIGWSELIRECHEKIITFDQSYQIYQIKEKFGGLRYYVKPTFSALIYKIDDLITPFMRRSYLICEVCGENGNLRKFPNGRNLMKTLCIKHGPEEMGFVSASITYVPDNN